MVATARPAATILRVDFIAFSFFSSITEMKSETNRDLIDYKIRFPEAHFNLFRFISINKFIEST